MRLLLNEAPIPDDDLCAKYNIPSYEDYKMWAKTEGRRNYEEWRDGQAKLISYSAQFKWSPQQRLAFSLVSALAILSRKPSFFVINSDFALQYATSGEPVPIKFEGVPLIYDKSGLAEIAWIL